MIEYQSTSPTWATIPSTTPINWRHPPPKGANAAYLFRAQQGIAIGDPVGQISVVSTTILYDTTRNCLCGSPGCGCGAR
ncbi:MAG: hypothetical protein SWZ49_19300 [Cyanobacteriota bacterium]|nr:hypothetical protein [Cyanobacteriota bacterium]